MPAENDSQWYDRPLREGEYDVAVVFRVTAQSQDAADDKVAAIVDDTRYIQGSRHGHIVPMYVPRHVR